VVEGFAQELGNCLMEQGLSGPVGVDMFLYREAHSEPLRLHPCVEINPRWTQGRVALALEKRVLPQSCSIWLHIPRSKFGDFVSLSDSLKKCFGFLLRLGKVLERGAVPTTNPKTAQGIWTVLLVAPTWEEWLKCAAQANPDFAQWVFSLVVEPQAEGILDFETNLT
jgi:hypothetical protein